MTKIQTSVFPKSDRKLKKYHKIGRNTAENAKKGQNCLNPSQYLCHELIYGSLRCLNYQWETLFL